MGSDDEISEDEEDILVYVEFEGLVDGNVFNEKQLQLDMIGIDTEHPIMQINGKFYEGTYEDVNGTYMFFTRNNTMVDDSVFDVASNFKYFSKTRKFLKMQRIFIKSRTEVLGDSEHNQCIPNFDTLKQAGIPFQHKNEALSFWQTIRNNRLNALHSYLEKQKVRQQKKSQGITLESESDEDNPFAMYQHKEEFFDLNKSECVNVDSGKELSSYNNQICQKFVYPKEANNETSNIDKNSCLKKLRKHPALSESESESESLESKGNDCRLIRCVKGYKIKIAERKELTVTDNRQKIKLKTKQTLPKEDKVRSRDI